MHGVWLDFVHVGELTELITHLAFYAGWPTANSAIGVARQVFAGTST